MASVQELWEDLREMTSREAGFAALVNPSFNAIIRSQVDWFLRLPTPQTEFELQQRYRTHIEMVEDWSNKSQPASAPEQQVCRRVLVVDDNVDAAKLLAMLAQFLGHDVKTAYDGAEAVQVAEQFLPEIIIMDLTMPRMNGYDAAKQIRSQPWGQHPMVLIALTGREEEEVRQMAREAGFDQHLVKPVTPDALKELLANI